MTPCCPYCGLRLEDETWSFWCRRCAMTITIGQITRDGDNDDD